MEQTFLICGVAGSGLFLVNLLIQFISGNAEVDIDVTEAHAASFDPGFKVLSFQGLTAFFMMFGWVGLALLKESGASPSLAIFGGTLAGVAAVWGIGRIFLAMKKLQSSGTLKISGAVGLTGSLYLSIPAGGTGKIEMNIQDHLQIFEARCDDRQELSTGTIVRVIRVEGETMIVQPVHPAKEKVPPSTPYDSER